MLLALDAILGHKSAHSLATGPVIALPKLKEKNLITIRLKKKTDINESITFHFALVVDYDTCVVFEVQKHSVLPSERFTLSDDHCWHYYGNNEQSYKTRARPRQTEYGEKKKITSPFLRSSGFPFLTVATIMSPDPAAGKRFRRPLMPWTAMTNKFLAPEREKNACETKHINTRARRGFQSKQSDFEVRATAFIFFFFYVPVLSAQLMTAPTGRPREMRNLAPAEPPRPEKSTFR